MPLRIPIVYPVCPLNMETIESRKEAETKKKKNEKIKLNRRLTKWRIVLRADGNKYPANNLNGTMLSVLWL